MATSDKVAAVEEVTDKLRNSNAAVVTAYTGLSVAQLKQLRRSLGENAQYRVVKNTLTKIAAKEAGVELDEHLKGSTAVAFVTGDPVEAAKSLRDFAKENPALVIKGGVLDGKALSADEIKKLADLESREVLLAKLAGALKATRPRPRLSSRRSRRSSSAPRTRCAPSATSRAVPSNSARVMTWGRPGSRSQRAHVRPPSCTSGTCRISGRTPSWRSCPRTTSSRSSRK